jgi:tRNA pseudouridine55 synthase
MDGILNVFKPTGMPSFKCLSIVKRRLGVKKIGFLGTLDPAASGVLVMLCGRATKLADKLHLENRKTYQSEFTFGIETATLDLCGEIVKTGGRIPMLAEIKSRLPEMVGNIEIEIPKFSAVHIDGKRAYELARAGVEFTAPKKNVNVSRFELMESPSQYLADSQRQPANESRHWFEIECETGTYIRSLAKLLAGKLGTVAIAGVIIRTRVGEFGIASAVPPDEITPADLKPIS